MDKELETILILDDESAIKENLSLFLETEGFNTISFNCAEKALEAMKEGQTFTLGIIDIRLPGINGEEFIQQAYEILPSMKFIVHTGSVNFEIDEELARIGICEKDIFKKPVVRIKELIDRIKEVI